MVLEKKNFKHFSYFFYVKLLSPPGAIVLVRGLRFLQREKEKKEREREGESESGREHPSLYYSTIISSCFDICKTLVAHIFYEESLTTET